MTQVLLISMHLACADFLLSGMGTTEETGDLLPLHEWVPTQGNWWKSLIGIIGPTPQPSGCSKLGVYLLIRDRIKGYYWETVHDPRGLLRLRPVWLGKHRSGCSLLNCR
ncbi:uncharacterized protein BDW43DRAFT_294291 [Aspergillus alliaceus]|uniref:uncharacterized protein n=1 Tax=Petromyces alliaceus TaxID=209559 RepID=UPI0012A5FAE8|nr:uncharacterized protein BDW43DRAFT_294291 [Aspergillus alliaceus]KAB8227387.1 hypothetical protein BDW43DRAFT_294291 [Aspergillus alliaceus]